MALFCVTAAVLLLANLSMEIHKRGAPAPKAASDLVFDVREPDEWYHAYGTAQNLSYGWPLFWRQYVFVHDMTFYGIVGECYSAHRLAVDVTLWLIILAVPAIACESLLRRYRPRLRWSLRTMLGAVGITACLFGWLIAARDRAHEQDDLIDVIQREHGSVRIERSGPAWLELIGADRYRREIIGANVDIDALIRRAASDDVTDEGGADEDRQEDREEDQQEGPINLDWIYEEESYREKALQFLERLGKLRRLRYLQLSSASLRPDIASALRNLRHLQMLSIEIRQVSPDAIEALADSLNNMASLRALRFFGRNGYGDDTEQEVSHECLLAIGKLTQLEYLSLSNMTVGRESLESLAGLTNLQSLGLYDIEQPYHERNQGRPLLSHLPALPRLEVLAVVRCRLGDIQYLARLPRLKTLTLENSGRRADLVKLASLESLEELAIGYHVVSARGLESLRTSKHLKRLHLQGLDHGPGSDVVPAVDDSQLDGCLRALALLRQSRPEIIIDNLVGMHLWPENRIVLPEDDVSDYDRDLRLREVLQKWKAQNAPGKSGLLSGP